MLEKYRYIYILSLKCCTHEYMYQTMYEYTYTAHV